MSIEAAKKMIMQHLNYVGKMASIIFYQMGFCWQGRREWLLFENGTKSEMIEFVRKGLSETLKIETILIAEGNKKKIEYKPVTETNLPRQDELGEFLNRPIFVLKNSRNGQP